MNCYSLEEDPTKWEVNKQKIVRPREERGINSDTCTGENGHANGQERGIQMERKRHPNEQERGIRRDAYKIKTKEYNKLSQSKFTESLTSTDPPSWLLEVGSDNVNKHDNAEIEEIYKDDSIALKNENRIKATIAMQIDANAHDPWSAEDNIAKIPQIINEINEVIHLYDLSPEEVREFLDACDYWAREVTEPNGFKEAFDSHLISYFASGGDINSECLKENEENKDDDVPF